MFDCFVNVTVLGEDTSVVDNLDEAKMTMARTLRRVRLILHSSYSSTCNCTLDTLRSDMIWHFCF